MALRRTNPKLTEPTYEQIAERAYYLFRDRSERGQPGSPESDWLDAERQLRAELSGSGTSRRRKPSSSPAGTGSSARGSKTASRAKAAVAGSAQETPGTTSRKPRARKRSG